MEAKTRKTVATFSLVAFDPETASLGVAVQSKFLAVGSVVPWARAGVGAVATQAMANYNYGPRGLDLMERGQTAELTLEALVSADEARDDRQVGVVDGRGGTATFTGAECFGWAGGVTGNHYAAQGNILVGGETVEALARTYEETEGDLASRLLAALDAGQAAGGDSRGKQSAALLVVREGGGYGGDNDRAVDLRVDDHPEPIRELIRIRDLHTLYFGETSPDDVVALWTGAFARRLRTHCAAPGIWKVRMWEMTLSSMLSARTFALRTSRSASSGAAISTEWFSST